MRFDKTLLVPSNHWTKIKALEGMNQPETHAYNYFRRVGYRVRKLEPRQRNDIIPKILSHLTFERNLIKPGVPDFICWNSSKYFFVECKSKSPTLTDAQVKWINEYVGTFDVIVLQVKADIHAHTEHFDPALSGYSHIRDNQTLNIQLFKELNIGKDIKSKIEKLDQIVEPLKKKQSAKTTNKQPQTLAEAILDNLIDMEYSDEILKEVFNQVSEIIENDINDKDKCWKAYEVLLEAVQRAFVSAARHRRRALNSLSHLIPEEKYDVVIEKKRAKIKSIQPPNLHTVPKSLPIQFQSGLEILHKKEGDRT